ncbi:hypothetical protein ASE14_09605 [Agromyces sp. Root81]|nr:hypothetical protein ASE14_09605 [Agromyces sp. Root81]
MVSTSTARNSSTFVAIALWLWLFNTLDCCLIGIVSVVTGILVGYVTFRSWATPKIDEPNISSGIEQIRRLLIFRAQPPKMRRCT